jgi:hypothetical protein
MMAPILQAIARVREAADLAFASADVGEEHTQWYDEECDRLDSLLEELEQTEKVQTQRI